MMSFHTVRFICTVTLAFFLCSCGMEKTVDTEIKNEQSWTVEKECTVTFKSEEIPEEIKTEMRGVTIHKDSPVTFDELSYLTLTYVGYDGESHMGNMIVNKELADEVISIFKELYEIEFPIELMAPAYKFNGDDNLSMENNNTSCFNDRPITGGVSLSYHQLGRAIDINPSVNPYVKASKGIVLPANAEAYVKRDVDAQGMINADSDCVKIFKKYGWSWGGDWKSLKDYQHFEKS